MPSSTPAVQKQGVNGDHNDAHHHHHASTAAAKNHTHTSSHTVSKPALKLKILDGLRQGDFNKFQQLLNTIFVPKDDPLILDVSKLLLHYAVQVAPLELIKEMVSKWVPKKSKKITSSAEDFTPVLDLNYQDENGDTPLHLAASQSRADIVTFLLSQPSINDCILNDSELQPLEVCKNLNIAQMMQVTRSKYLASITKDFKNALNARDFKKLNKILDNPRNQELLDMNGMDSETGSTYLHEFIKKKDVHMCRWLLEHGADPFKRDRSGKLPSDLLNTVDENEASNNPILAIDLQLRKILEKSAKEQSVINVANNLNEAPTLKGYLKKWTNFAQGYKLRWFVLSSDGKLAYFKDQADTKNKSRGYLNMGTCLLHLDSSEKLKFEIVGGSNGTVRWHLKGNHPIETNRWVWAIQGAIRFAKDKELLKGKNVITPATVINSVSREASMKNTEGRSRSKSMDGKRRSRIKGSVNKQINPNEIKMNNNLTASGKNYINKVIETRLESTSPTPNKNTPTHSAGTSIERKPKEKQIKQEQVPKPSQEVSNNAEAVPKMPVVPPHPQKSDVSVSQVPTDAEVSESHAIESSVLPTEEASVHTPDARTETNLSATSTMTEESDVTEADFAEGEGLSDEDEDAIGFKIDMDDEDLQIEYGPYAQECELQQKNITIELSSLMELLESGSPDKESWDLVKNSVSTVSQYFKSLSTLTSNRDTKLLAMITKQRDVNNVWVQSVRDLENELGKKSQRLESMDKERMTLKRAVTKKISQENDLPTINKRLSVHDGSTTTLAEVQKFISATKDKDEDSDVEEFFDAEDAAESDDSQVSLEKNVPISENEPWPEVEEDEVVEPVQEYEVAEPLATQEVIDSNKETFEDELQNEEETVPIAKPPTKKGEQLTDNHAHMNEIPQTNGAVKEVDNLREIEQISIEKIRQPVSATEAVPVPETDVVPLPNEKVIVEPDLAHVPAVMETHPVDSAVNHAITTVPATGTVTGASSEATKVSETVGKKAVDEREPTPQQSIPQADNRSVVTGSTHANSENHHGHHHGHHTHHAQQNNVARDAVESQEVENHTKKAPEHKAVAKKEPLPKMMKTKLVAVTTKQKKVEEMMNSQYTWLGYEDGIRKRLKLSEDDRPKISLWSVLKSMVGKDMTRMTLPVTFNEPTSLLQRVAEDLEYSELLDQACGFEDSTLRMLYVAAFTASSSASTTLRVAKPFNPLLGETFEYSRPDKHYRFFTEQVSHHPPVSATWTESPRWNFWGESYVDTKFNGRSFEVNHLGLWYVNLRPDNASHPEELYTWKKPNNTVIGILVGNPQVDNHGDVIITNHTTGDKCTLHFKARGWRSSGAYEVRGEVFDKNGDKKWVLGGHWNEAYYAKKITSKSKGDISLDKKNLKPESNGPSQDGSRFLLWKVNARPDAPFHLTPFAITLNAPQPHLVKWVAPTDTRLRPDQRAMEDGEYDKAAEDKNRLEEKQRAVRRKREETNETYNPKWFTKEKHPVTKKSYWKFTGDYWVDRVTHNWERSDDIF